MSILCCSVFSARNLYAQALDASSVELRNSCERLIDDSRDGDSLKALMTYAQNTNGIDHLRSLSTVGGGLAALFSGNTNLYIRARNWHARHYPEDMHLLSVNLEKCQDTCRNCRGKGFVIIKCPDCQGKGMKTCRSCKGKGVRMVPIPMKGTKSIKNFPCNRCKGTGEIKCRRCGGGGRINVECKVCKGKPSTFKTPDQVYNDFDLIVREIVEWINNEEVFQEKFNTVKQLDDIERRIAEYKKLIRTYSDRDEVVELENLLAADVKIKKEQDDIENEQDDIENDEVRSLLKLKDSETPVVAATTIREYLASNPDCKSKVKLQTLAVQLVAKGKKKRRQRQMIYFLCGIFIFLFGLSCINITHYKYDIFNSRSKLPGEKK
ncbi:MAG: hypothetical protein PF904_05580 [Kiritimatiellae bacterium]|nr:hypothetical protein [Kiritimatiellia bacterium]